MARYQEWMMKHQDALVEPENPLVNKRLITENGVAERGKPGSMMGYGIIQADSIEAAEAIAKTNPFLAMGDIELAQIMEMTSIQTEIELSDRVVDMITKYDLME